MTGCWRIWLAKDRVKVSKPWRVSCWMGYSTTAEVFDNFCVFTCEKKGKKTGRCWTARE